MDVAQRIQTEILPKNPTLPKLDLACFMSPADEVGGDYYDIFQHEDKSWLVVGDVAGHGVASGLVMFMVQSIMATLIQSQNKLKPGELNYLANTILCKNFERLEEDRPMTLVTLCTTDSRNFQISGSHDNIYIYRHADNKIDTIIVDHFPFGIGLSADLEKELFQTDTFQLKERDILFLGTDGITEAFKDGQDTNEQFGEERLVNIIKKHSNKPVHTIKEMLLLELESFTKGIYFDDVTFIIAQAK
jgi:serine phosphatase RsbU (regulator of sigma subunit)